MKRCSRFRYPLVVVVWQDAISHYGERESIEHEPATQYLTGWLLKRNRTGVTLATEYNGDDDGHRDEHFVPAKMILKVEVIKK